MLHFQQPPTDRQRARLPSRHRRKNHPLVLMRASCVGVLLLLSHLHGASGKSQSFLPPKRQSPPATNAPARTTATRRIRAAVAPSLAAHNEAAWVSGVKNSLASALAAGCSKLILAPFDTIKTLQQHARTGVGAAAPVGRSSLSLLGAAELIMARPRGFLEFYVSRGRRNPPCSQRGPSR